MPIEQGHYVTVKYTGTLDDGTVFDSSDQHDGEPLIFQVGAGQMIPGFDKAVVGMNVGEEKQIHIAKEEAYGDLNPDMVKEIPRKNFPEEGLKEGITVVLGTPDGMQFPAKIMKVTDKKVTIDLNPPLAGKALNFKIKIVEFSKEAPEGFNAGGCGCGCEDDDHEGHEGCGHDCGSCH